MLSLATVLSLCVSSALAAVSFGDATVFSSSTVASPGIFPVGGSGIGNGGFSLNTEGSLQVGLRAGERFFSDFLSNDGVGGNATYFATAGYSPTSGGDPTPAPPLGSWNYYVHFDARGYTGTVGSLILTVQESPNLGGGFFSVDLFSLVPPSPPGPAVQLLQGSSNLGFAPTLAALGFDANAPGEYEFTLTAFDVTGAPLLSTEMTVEVAAAPEPATLIVWSGLAGLCAVGVAVRRKSA